MSRCAHIFSSLVHTYDFMRALWKWWPSRQYVCVHMEWDDDKIVMHSVAKNTILRCLGTRQECNHFRQRMDELGTCRRKTTWTFTHDFSKCSQFPCIIIYFDIYVREVKITYVRLHTAPPYGLSGCTASGILHIFPHESTHQYLSIVLCDLNRALIACRRIQRQLRFTATPAGVYCIRVCNILVVRCLMGNGWNEIYCFYRRVSILIGCGAL